MPAHHSAQLAVIGGGSGGYAAARTTAAAGLKTIVVEGGDEVGGLCILRGCMPTKALLYSAEVAHLSRHAGVFGVRNPSTTVDFQAVMDRKNRLIADFAGYRQGQLTSGKFGFIRAKARFNDAHTVQLDNGETVTADHFVISTGSIVSPCPIAELADMGYWTSDDALMARRAPASLIVLGGGVVAVELAQFFARVGTKVTLIQRSARILKEEDGEASETLTAVFRREGIDVFTGTKIISARRSGPLKELLFEHEGTRKSVEAEEVLFALGRTPNTAALNLPAAGVETADGRGVTDASMRTTAPHIFAAGDCCGPYEVVHLAITQGETAARNIIHPGGSSRMDYRLKMSVVFTEPQIARVGLTEEEARASKTPFLSASYPFNDHGKSMIMEALDGHVKLLADPASGEILGGSCVGPSGGELIHEITACMAKRMTVRELASMPHYHPTLAEIWTYPAEELADQIKTP